MICELVDNALDAATKRIWIEFGRRAGTVLDDGNGMEGINDAIRFGKRTRAERWGHVFFKFARARHRVESTASAAS